MQTMDWIACLHAKTGQRMYEHLLANEERVAVERRRVRFLIIVDMHGT